MVVLPGDILGVIIMHTRTPALNPSEGNYDWCSYRWARGTIIYPRGQQALVCKAWAQRLRATSFCWAPISFRWNTGFGCRDSIMQHYAFIDSLPETDARKLSQVALELSGSRMKVYQEARSQGNRHLGVLPDNWATSTAGSAGIAAVCAGGAAVLCLDIHQQDDSLMVIGGSTGTVAIITSSEREGSGTSTSLPPPQLIQAHDSAVTAARFHPHQPLLFTGGKDSTVKLWGPGYLATVDWHTQAKNDPVTSIVVHPSSDYFAASTKAAWALHNPSRAFSILEVQAQKSFSGDGFSATEFHPDGLLLGTAGTAGVVSIWDLRLCKCVVQLQHQNTVAPALSLSFCHNGYDLASCNGHEIVIWDLRKVQPGGAVLLSPCGYCLSSLSALLPVKTCPVCVVSPSAGSPPAICVIGISGSFVRWPSSISRHPL